MSITIDRLKYFAAAVKYKSYSVAAEFLCVTPQAISRSMAEFEKELNLKLFTKKGRNIEPTKVAYDLLGKAQDVIHGVEDLQSYLKLLASESIKDSELEGQLVVAVTSSPYEGNPIGDEQFMRFRTRFPKVELFYTYGSTSSCFNSVQEGISDVFITFGRLDQSALKCTKLYDVVVHPVVSITHPLKDRSRISLTDLCKYPLGTPYDIGFADKAIEQHLAKRGLHPDYKQTMTFIDEYTDFIHANGIGFAVFTKDFSTRYPDLTFLELKRSEMFNVPVCMIYKQDSELIAALRKYLLQTNS